MSLFLYIFFISILGFCLNYDRFINMVVMMEFVVLSLFLMLLFSEYSVSIHLLYYLIFSVCEGILGLLILLTMYRFWGGDFYQLIDYDIN